MKNMKKTTIMIAFLLSTMMVKSQTIWDEIKIDPEKEIKYLPYVEYKHSFGEGFKSWKSNNKFLYIKEMWYYTESFYIKRNHLDSGNSMDESLIDVSRFENYRKETEESIISIPGFKDAIVLLPSNKLIYKP